MTGKAISAWHEIVATRSTISLDALLADGIVFHSPVVHTPQVGRAITKKYLTAACDILFNGSFSYVREIVNEHDAALEFMVEIDGVVVNGVDMIRWDEDDRIVDIKVMLRPLKAINLIHKLMASKLESK
jgi:hypothetical protein